MKKIMSLAPALALALAAVSVLAQEPIGSAADQMFTEATNLVAEVKPLLIAFLVSAFGITIGFVSYKLAKRGANKI